MAMPMPAYIDSSEDECDSPKFTKGQEVWCLFDKIYYKAKVLSVGLEIDGEQYYPIHYFKFSKKYDEPVKESRLLPIKLKSNKYIRKFNKNTVAERKKKRLEKKLKDEIMEIAYSGLPVTKQRPFLNLKRLSMEMVSTTPKIQTVSNDGKELVSHAERNVVSECQPLEGRKEYEQTNEIDSIVDKSQQISTLELQLNNFPSTSEQDLEQVAIKTLDNMLSNTLKRQNVNKLVKDQSQLAVHECEEVTTSNKEDELLSKNSACLIDANDDTINKIMINNEDEVTTSSKTDEQLMLDDQDTAYTKEISSLDKSRCNMLQTSSSEMKDNSFGSTTVMRTSEKLISAEMYLNFKQIINANINNVDAEVTTSKLDDQGNIISSNDNLVGNNSNGDNNLDEEVTTSKQEYCSKELNCPQNIICCELSRYLTSFYGGPVRISKVSIVAERLDSENMDVHEQNFLHGEDNVAHHNINVSLNKDNKIEHCIVPSRCSHVGCKTDLEFDKNDKFNKIDSFGNASSMTLVMEDNNKRQIDNTEGDNLIAKKMKTYSTDMFNSKSNVSSIKEDDNNMKEVMSISVAASNNEINCGNSHSKTYDGSDSNLNEINALSTSSTTSNVETNIVNHCNGSSYEYKFVKEVMSTFVAAANFNMKIENFNSKSADEDDNNMKDVTMSTSVAASNDDTQIDNLYSECTDENLIDSSKVILLSAFTNTSNNETKCVNEDDHNMNEEMSTSVTASNDDTQIDNLYSECTDENLIDSIKEILLPAFTNTSNNETKIVNDSNGTRHEDDSNLEDITTSISVAESNDDTKINTFYSKFADDNLINTSEEILISAFTNTSNNESKIVSNGNRIEHEDDNSINEEMSTSIATSNNEINCNNLYSENCDVLENDNNSSEVKALSTSTITSNNGTKSVVHCNETSYSIMSNDNSASSLDENNYSQIIHSSSSITTKINNKKKIQNSDDGKTDGESSSTLKTVSYDKKTSKNFNDATSEVSKSDLQKKSYGSEASSSSTQLSNNLVESDNDNEQTSDDDDRDVKNKKVTMEKLSDEDHSIFELFGYDKAYSRAAKVKANEAISQMSKPPTNKEKKNETVKRVKNGRKKDDDDLSDEIISWSYYNIDLPLYVQRILIEDKHLVEDDRFIPRIPAEHSVYTILCDYASKFPVCMKTLDILFDAFNKSLEKWLLHYLEKPKYSDMIQQYSKQCLNQIYGLTHLLRFLIKLPRLFHMLRNNPTDFIPQAVFFVKGLLVYLVDENLPHGIADYDVVMPETYRRACY